MADGSEYDGKDLLTLVREGKSPFQGAWDVNLLVQEIEENLNTKVVDAPMLYDGANYYVKFEAAVYDLLRNESNIKTSNLLYCQIPEQRPEPRFEVPVDIVGRALFLFKKEEGEKNIYNNLSAAQRATIRNMGDMIGWPSDNVVVGPNAFAAKKSLLDFIPAILPSGDDEACYYRLVLEHGDYGIHNISILQPENGTVRISPLFDWETGCIVPALLSDPTFWVKRGGVGGGENGDHKLVDVSESATAEEIKTKMTEAQEYTTKLFKESPEYYRAIVAGKDARHLWFALGDWRGENPEGYFGALGAWAERRMEEMGKV